MTLSQLRAFALVARLGSMRAAAAALGISEPAVSSAVAALRRDLGDALVVRSGGGIALTPGGHRLAAHADEIVGLADRARREVAAAGTSQDVLRVAVTPSFGEHAAASLFDTFRARFPGTSLELHRLPSARLAPALLEHVVDIAFGVRPSGGGSVALDVVPLLRWSRVVVVAADHPLAQVQDLAPTALRHERWVAGPGGLEESAEEGRWQSGSGVVPDVSCLSSEAEALEEVRGGGAVMLALSHVVDAELRARTLVRLPVPGAPVKGLWCASLLGQGRSASGARALQRFCTTPDAIAAMVTRADVPRPRPPQTVRVTLWS